jgi:hypothetical protein
MGIFRSSLISKTSSPINVKYYKKESGIGLPEFFNSLFIRPEGFIEKFLKTASATEANNKKPTFVRLNQVLKRWINFHI